MSGLSPAPPDPACQQIPHGVPAAAFSGDELLYLPRNLRLHRLYGMNPVEQIALTVNIALRREQATLAKDWKVDQIKQFRDFDARVSGNLAPDKSSSSGRPTSTRGDASAAAQG